MICFFAPLWTLSHILCWDTKYLKTVERSLRGRKLVENLSRFENKQPWNLVDQLLETTGRSRPVAAPCFCEHNPVQFLAWLFEKFEHLASAEYPSQRCVLSSRMWPGSILQDDSITDTARDQRLPPGYGTQYQANNTTYNRTTTARRIRSLWHHCHWHCIGLPHGLGKTS